MMCATVSPQSSGLFLDFGLLKDYRRNGKYSDFILQSGVGDSKVMLHCHKIVLGTISPFFRHEFENGGKSSMLIEEVDQETLEILIDYIYGGGICLTKENVFRIFPAAQRFMLQDLESNCMAYITSLISVKDVISVFEFALIHSWDTLTNACLKFILQNLQLVKEHGFLNLDHECVKLVAVHQKVHGVPPAEEILGAVIEWIHADETQRAQYAFYLIKDIPLVQVRLKVLRALLREDTFMQSIPLVYSLYVDAVEEIGLKIEGAKVCETKAIVDSTTLKENYEDQKDLQPEVQPSDPGNSFNNDNADAIAPDLLNLPADDSSNAALKVNISSFENKIQCYDTPENSLPNQVSMAKSADPCTHNQLVPKSIGGSNITIDIIEKALEANIKNMVGKKRATADLDTTELEEGEIIDKPRATKSPKISRSSARTNPRNRRSKIASSKRSSDHCNKPVTSIHSKIHPKTNISSKKSGNLSKGVVYFVAREHVESKYENSIVAFNLESRHLETLAKHLDFDFDTSLVYHKQKLYSLGSSQYQNPAKCNSIHVLNVRKKCWEDNELEHGRLRRRFKPIILEDYLYTVGGLTSVAASPQVERLSLHRSSHCKWEDVQPFPHPICNFGICVVDKRIYVVGGSRWNRFTQQRKWKSSVSGALVCFDSGRKRWSKRKSMPISRRDHAVVVVGKQIYALGGVAEQAGSDVLEIVNAVDVYDTRRDSWSSSVPMKKKRQHFSAIVYNKYIYAIGGDSETCPTMERLSIERQSWEDPEPLPSCGFYHSVELGYE